MSAQIELSEVLGEKLRRLRELLGGLGAVAVAFSGGVDSTLLLTVAHQELGDGVLAITARSETFPESEFEEALAYARSLGVRWQAVETNELEVEGFAENPPDRCYHCKRELFRKMQAVGREQGIEHLVDGANVDDVGDFRPGMRAARELGVRSPLREAGLRKDDVRELSRALGLSTWDKPAFACLASRFPYGQKITAEKLRMVGEAEALLRGLGYRQCRVRHHGEVARIEVPAEQVAGLAEEVRRGQVVERLKRLGFTYVALDLEGYRSGSMNEVLPRADRSAQEDDHAS